MGKQEMEKMLRLALDFLEGLSAKQFQELVEGKAKIRFEARVKDTHHEELLEKIKQEAKHASDVKKILEGLTKKDLIPFCSYMALKIKSKDTKKIIFQKIASHLQIDPSWYESKEITGPVKWEDIEIALHNCQTVDEGKRVLLNQDSLRWKKDIIAFARSLEVYVSQQYTKQELLERIVDSVVGARIRGKVIRLEDS